MSDLAKRLGRKIAERVTQSKESGALSPENIDKLKGAAQNNARIIAGKVDASARRLAPKLKSPWMKLSSMQRHTMRRSNQGRKREQKFYLNWLLLRSYVPQSKRFSLS